MDNKFFEHVTRKIVDFFLNQNGSISLEFRLYIRVYRIYSVSDVDLNISLFLDSHLHLLLSCHSKKNALSSPLSFNCVSACLNQSACFVGRWQHAHCSKYLQS